jgi:hypothetical protein
MRWRAIGAGEERIWARRASDDSVTTRRLGQRTGENLRTRNRKTIREYEGMVMELVQKHMRTRVSDLLPGSRGVTSVDYQFAWR